MHAPSRTIKDKKRAPKGWMDHYVESQTKKQKITKKGETKPKSETQPKSNAPTNGSGTTKEECESQSKKRKKKEWCLLSKEEYEENLTWLLHKDWWLLDELDRQSQQEEVRIIRENIKQREREASAKALAEKTVWKCPSSQIESAKAFNMVLRREKNKAAALEKIRLSVEREKLAPKKAEEKPTLALMVPAGTEKQKKEKALMVPAGTEKQKKAISVTKQIRKNKVDSISPKKKCQPKKKSQPSMK
jgi:hypothetical protein